MILRYTLFLFCNFKVIWSSQLKVSSSSLPCSHYLGLIPKLVQRGAYWWPLQLSYMPCLHYTGWVSVPLSLSLYYDLTIKPKVIIAVEEIVSEQGDLDFILAKTKLSFERITTTSHFIAKWQHISFIFCYCVCTKVTYDKNHVCMRLQKLFQLKIRLEL